MTISFNLAPGKSLSDAVQAGSRPRRRSGSRPACRGFTGNRASLQQSLSSQPVLIILALLAVYIVLGVLYESYVHP